MQISVKITNTIKAVGDAGVHYNLSARDEKLLIELLVLCSITHEVDDYFDDLKPNLCYTLLTVGHDQSVKDDLLEISNIYERVVTSYLEKQRWVRMKAVIYNEATCCVEIELEIN